MACLALILLLRRGTKHVWALMAHDGESSSWVSAPRRGVRVPSCGTGSREDPGDPRDRFPWRSPSSLLLSLSLSPPVLPSELSMVKAPPVFSVSHARRPISTVSYESFIDQTQYLMLPSISRSAGERTFLGTSQLSSFYISHPLVL